MLTEVDRFRAIDILMEAERTRTPAVQLSKSFPEIEIADSYAISSEIARRKISAGAKLIGHKIGLTSKAMQQSSQIDEPDYGYLLDGMIVADGAKVPHGNYCIPRVEPELAFVLGKPLEGPGVGLLDVLRATEYVVPAIEIIDARVQNPRKITDTVADNGAAAGIILGGRPVGPMEVDLRWVGAVFYRNSEIEETGIAAGVMGHPALGIAWLAKAGFPAGALNVIHGDAEVGRALVSHPAVDFITFTGSTRAGAAIRVGTGLKRVALELGGNGVTIVHSDADLSAAASACARNSMRLAGQSCISVQTVLVQRGRFDAFLALLVEKVREVKLGDPLDNATDVGTLIDEVAAKRVESWVAAAIRGGAKICTGGTRHGAAYEPTVLVDARPDMDVVCNEVFGPVVSVLHYDDLSEAVAFINKSRFGLQCGIFTSSNQITFDLIRSLKTGGIIVNGTSTWRTDQLAYGGVRDSGMGREGPRYAIEDMTDQRLVVFNL